MTGTTLYTAVVLHFPVLRFQSTH